MVYFLNVEHKKKAQVMIDVNLHPRKGKCNYYHQEWSWKSSSPKLKDKSKSTITSFDPNDATGVTDSFDFDGDIILLVFIGSPGYIWILDSCYN